MDFTAIPSNSIVADTKNSLKSLITELNLSILSECSVPTKVSDALMPKLKRESLEIVLKHNRSFAYGNDDDPSKEFDMEREISILLFTAKMEANVNPAAQPSYDNLRAYFDSIDQDRLFLDNEVSCKMLRLLIFLGTDFSVPNDKTVHLLVPGPFTLHANYIKNKHYPKLCPNKLLPVKPRCFKLMQPQKEGQDPFKPKFLLGGDENLLSIMQEQKLKLLPLTQPNIVQEERTFFGPSQHGKNALLLPRPAAFRLEYDAFENEPLIEDEEEPLEYEFQADFKEIKPPVEPKILSWSWESLGCQGMKIDKPFFSDSNISPLYLQAVIEEHNGREFKIKTVTQRQFLKDLKSLTVGIQSDIYKWDARSAVFIMEPNLTIEGTLSHRAQTISKRFLIAATQFKFLRQLIAEEDKCYRFQGFMFKALTSALDEYLSTFMEFVYAVDDETICEYLERMFRPLTVMGQLHKMILNYIAKKGPNCVGSELLSFLYETITGVIERDFTLVLMSIMRRCCHVYFKYLQKWIFYGLLDDPYQELFISHINHYQPKTKHFYDKAYVVRRCTVPGFLQNYEDKILQCGKYTMLLRSYKPNHALFGIDNPAISVHLSADEIQNLKSICEQYLQQVRKACGPPPTVQDIFKAREAQKAEKVKMMREHYHNNLKLWTEEQQALAREAAEKKRKRLQELTEQIETAKARKVAERRENVVHELMLLEELKKQEELHLMRETEILQKRIAGFKNFLSSAELGTAEETAFVLEKSLVKSPSDKILVDNNNSGEADYESCVSKPDDGDADSSSCNYDKLQTLETSKQSTVTANATQSMATISLTPLNATETIEQLTSDILNSNTVPELALSELQMNRQKILSGSNMLQCVQISESTITTAETGESENSDKSLFVKTDTNEQLSSAFSEAKRNKLKMLNEEFDFHTLCATPNVPDINLNELKESELTDLQRNRKRMMQDDLFSEYNKDPLQMRVNLHLSLDTPLERNRRKLMASEFDIMTPEPSPRPNSTTTETLQVEEVMTPMSTTSDTTMTESLTFAAELNNDVANGNTVTTSNLKVKIVTNQEEDLHLQLHTASTMPEQTPEYALNTAGLLAKREGFNFDIESAKKMQKMNLTKDDHLKNETLFTPVDNADYITPYKRSKELIESDFKCKSINSLIRLRKLDDQELEKRNEFLLQCKEVHDQGFGIVRLTDLLRKSVVVPFEAHFSVVSEEVMRVFLEDLQTIDHFRSLRNYFLLMDGEFGDTVCNGLISRLENDIAPQELYSYQTLHAILEVARTSSIYGNNKHGENLSFIVDHVPEKFDKTTINVFSHLTLAYQASWPLNYILTNETLEKYNKIFHFLLKVRRISWLVEKACQSLKEAYRRHGAALLRSPQYHRIQHICMKFYHFVDTLKHHITANALQSTWAYLKSDLMQAKCFEDIYQKHVAYLKRIFFLCLLNRTSSEFHSSIENILTITLHFSYMLKSRDFLKNKDNDNFTHARYDRILKDEEEFDKNIKFIIHIGIKIVDQGYQEEFGYFLNLINFNDYYQKNTEKQDTRLIRAKK